MNDDPHALFWSVVLEVQGIRPDIVEGRIMGGRCVRVGTEFLALCDYKHSGLVVKLPAERVRELIELGIGQSFAPAHRVFKEWLSLPSPDRFLWRDLMLEGADFVGGV